MLRHRTLHVRVLQQVIANLVSSAVYVALHSLNEVYSNVFYNDIT